MTRMLDPPSHMKRHFQREEQQMSPSKLTKVLRLPRKMTIQHLAEILRKTVLQRHFQCAGLSETVPRPFRSGSETVPRPFPSVRNSATQQRLLFALRTSVLYWQNTTFRAPAIFPKYSLKSCAVPRKVTTPELHQSTAPATKSDTWTSPSTAPATKSNTWTFTKYCAYHAKWQLELHQVLRLPRKVTLDLHQVLRLPRKVTLDLHQLLRLPHRMTRRLDPYIWNVISNARSNKCHPPNSPHTAPATQNDHPTSARNLRKTGETSFPMRGRSDQDPRPLREWSETVSVSPQPATQQRLLFALRTSVLYWKIQHFALRLSFQISPSTAPATKSDTWTSPSTAPTTQSDTWTSPSTAPATKSDTWTSPSTAPTTQSDTWTSPSTAPTTQSDTWTSPTTAPTTQRDTWPSPTTAPATQRDAAIVIVIDSTITQRF